VEQVDALVDPTCILVSAPQRSRLQITGMAMVETNLSYKRFRLFLKRFSSAQITGMAMAETNFSYKRFLLLL
jgi:hypothetical protein